MHGDSSSDRFAASTQRMLPISAQSGDMTPSPGLPLGWVGTCRPLGYVRCSSSATERGAAHAEIDVFRSPGAVSTIVGGVILETSDYRGWRPVLQFELAGAEGEPPEGDLRTGARLGRSPSPAPPSLGSDARHRWAAYGQRTHSRRRAGVSTDPHGACGQPVLARGAVLWQRARRHPYRRRDSPRLDDLHGLRGAEFARSLRGSVRSPRRPPL